MRRSFWIWSATVCLFGLLAALLTWPRLPDAAHSVVDYGDPLAYIWRLRWIDHALLHDPAHLYEAPIFYGFPESLAYDNIQIGPAVLALPLTSITGRVDTAYNLLIVFSYALSGLAAFALVRHVTGSAGASVVGGVVYAFWSYTLAHISHLAELSLYPIPLALLCLHRLAETPWLGAKKGELRRTSLWAAGFVACFVWQALCSFYSTAYLALASGGLLVWEALVVRRWQGWAAVTRAQVVVSILIALSVAASMVAVISAPYRDAQAKLGLYRTIDEQVAWSAQVQSYLSVSPRNQVYNRILPVAWPEPLFPGFVALVLAGVGVGALAIGGQRARGDAGEEERRVNRRVLGLYLALAVGAALLSFGPVWNLGGVSIPLPYAALAVLPGFNGLRAPVRIAPFFALGLGVLAGWGWLRTGLTLKGVLGSRPARGWGVSPNSRASVLTLGLAAIVAIMTVEQWTVTPSEPMPPGRAGTLLAKGETPPAYTWLAQQGEGVVAEMPVIVDATQDYTRMYYQGVHGHALMNGHSSFVPPVYNEIGIALDEPQEIGPPGIGILQSLEVRYVLVYKWAYESDRLSTLTASLGAFPEVKLAGDFVDDYAFVLDPLPDGARLKLGWRLPPEIPLGASTPITVTITNPYKYPLLTRLQQRLELEAQWSAGEVVKVDLDVPLTVEQGAHLYAATIIAPGTAGEYHFRMRPALPVPRYVVDEDSVVSVGRR